MQCAKACGGAHGYAYAFAPQRAALLHCTVLLNALFTSVSSSQGVVEVVEGEDRVLVRSTTKIGADLGTLPFSAAELRKYFEIGDHVHAVSGANAGVSGMVLQVRRP